MSEEELEKTNARSFMKFMRLPVMLYKTIGDDIFDHRSTDRLKSQLFKVYFYFSFLNLNILMIQELIYVLIAMGSPETMLEATAAAPCIGFVLVGDFKQIAMTVNRVTLRKHMEELERMFPTGRRRQAEFQVPRYEKKMMRAMTIFSILCLGFIFTFIFYPIIKSSIQYYLLGYPVFERKFGFYIWYPFDAVRTMSIYLANYMIQAHGAYVSAIEFLSADLLLMSSVTQLCMHFDYISNQLLTFHRAEGPRSEELEVQFLQRLVKHHTKCLELSEDMNRIFSLSLLLNFLTASLTICFIGFQVTASTLEDIFKYFIFLLASISQVFVVCYYGDELITASTGVGSAAYHQNWIQSSPKYKKMLTFLIMRSQKGASIRAPTFPPISFNTFMRVISMSYQFFALLRTTYYKK